MASARVRKYEFDHWPGLTTMIANGITGQAWGCTAAGLALVCNLVALMHRLGVVSAGAAVRVVFLQAAAALSLVFLTFAISSASGVQPESLPPRPLPIFSDPPYSIVRLVRECMTLKFQ